MKLIIVEKNGQRSQITKPDLKDWEAAGYSKIGEIENNGVTAPDPKSSVQNESAATPEGVGDDLKRIKGVNKNIAKALVDAGLETYEKVVSAPDIKLIAISGIGEKNVDRVRNSAKKLLSD
ncbi:MAG: helix-hairpin-helix domain-containing protein [Candidatus Auribacterota bacterium]|nr:helix-hairpin-helix domain-containing protein [Candidatus Auribacterota bacterium]